MKQFFLIALLTCLFSVNSRGSAYFWIGNSGNWDDLNHWATTSGGTTLHTQIPTALDDVFFDANSFTVPGQIVTLNTLTILCRDMTWAGVTNTPTLTGPAANLLKIYGSVTFVAGMNISFGGVVNFEATTLGNTINSGGKSFPNSVTFNGAGGEWSLQDAFTTSQTLFLNNGTLNTNNQTVNARNFSSVSGTPRTLNMGSSIFNLVFGSSWSVTPGGIILNCGTAVINASGANFAGGNQTYYDVNLLSFNADISGNNIFHNVSFAGTGTGGIAGNNSINNVSFAGNGILYNDNTFNNAVFSKNGTIQGNNSFTNLTFTAGYTYVLTSGKTQTINGSFTASGNCGALININSTSSGSQSAISHPPGSVAVSFVTLKDINGIGGASFTANNSVDLGNNTGWIINAVPAQDFYWIGNGGNWNDGSHWSFSSGGAPSGCSPTPADNVFFDANSFSIPGQTVTLNALTAYCSDMSWAGVTNNPTLAGGTANLLKIYGSLSFVAGMNLTTFGPVSFEATTTGKTVSFGGKSLKNSVIFNGIGGEWTLQDALSTLETVVLNNGTLTTNNQTVNAKSFSSSSFTARTLNMGSSVFNLSSGGSWSVGFSGIIVNCGTSVINLSGTIVVGFNGGSQTYYDLNFLGLGGAITGNNMFHNVSFAGLGSIYNNNSINNVSFGGNATLYNNNTINNAVFSKNGTFEGNNSFTNLTFSAGYTYILTSGRTQTITGTFTSSGNCGALIGINSNTPGSQSAISHPPGAVAVSFMLLKDINATGGATFTANNTLDLGNNTGWTINTLPPKNLYWIGNGGNWDDGNHWSLSSGGAPSGCSPTPADNVFFDANSFSIPGQTILINAVTVYCSDMTWAGVTNTPTLAGPLANLLKIYGSLSFVAGMNLSVFGPVNFEATSSGKTISCGGKAFNGVVSFNGIGGEWTLQDAFSTTQDLYLYNGTLTTNNKNVNMRAFSAGSATLNMGSSIFHLSAGFWNVSSGTNLNCGTSVINSIAEFFNGGNKTYYDLNFLGGNGDIGTANNTFHNVSFTGIGMGSISGNNTINNLSVAGNATIQGNNIIDNAVFSKNATIQGNNTFNNLTFTAGYTYTLVNGYTQTITGRWLTQGSCTSYIILQSSVAGSFSTVTKTTGVVTGFNIHIRDIHCTGGSNFIAYNSVDLGGNSGWNFQTLPPLSTPGSINGPASFCPGASGVTYYIAPVAGAISYTWSVPAGATITSGQGDTLITVDFGASSGNVTVTAFSGCAFSSNNSLPVSLNLSTLAAATGSVQVCKSGNVSAAGTYYLAAPCDLIAKVVPSGASPVSGTINACVIIDGSIQYYNAEPYVQRHYDIEPTSNPNSATATVTLYFKDQEFVDFNAVNSAFPDLPTVAGGGNSDPNIANVKVTQYHGVPIAPHNVGNPAPGFYTSSTGVLLTPTLVNYNSTNGYWEVTLQVNGFSGFYVHTNIWNAPLPISVNYFTGTRQGGKHLLNWKVTCNATASATLTLERSADARNFTSIYKIKADALRCLQPFDHIDAQPLYGINFYRLKMEDAEGKISYSIVINLLNAVNNFDIINIVPNPVTGGSIKLNVNSGLSSEMEIVISDIQGRIVDRQSIPIIAGLNGINLNIGKLAKGTYNISTFIGKNKSRTLRFVKN